MGALTSVQGWSWLRLDAVWCGVVRYGTVWCGVEVEEDEVAGTLLHARLDVRSLYQSVNTSKEVITRGKWFLVTRDNPSIAQPPQVAQPCAIGTILCVFDPDFREGVGRLGW